MQIMNIYQYLLIFSKWVELIKVTKERGKHIALKLVRDILCHYGSFKVHITPLTKFRPEIPYGVKT